MAELMLTMLLPSCFSRCGTAALLKAERAGDVEVERPLEHPLAGVEQRLRTRAARVVDDDVEPAELGDGLVDQSRDRFGVVHVERDHQRPAAEGGDVRRHFLELLLGAGGQHDIGTGFGERPGYRGANAAAGTGDDGDAVGELENVGERSIEERRGVGGRGHAQMLPRGRRGHPPARRALEHPQLQQERLVDVLDRLLLLAHADGEGREPNRPAAEAARTPR